MSVVANTESNGIQYKIEFVEIGKYTLDVVVDGMNWLRIGTFDHEPTVAECDAITYVLARLDLNTDQLPKTEFKRSDCRMFDYRFDKPPTEQATVAAPNDPTLYTVIIEHVATGARVTITQPHEIVGEDVGHRLRYMWEEGNYSCDCNRSTFFVRAVTDNKVDWGHRTCGDGQYRVHVIYMCETVYNEMPSEESSEPI